MSKTKLCISIALVTSVLVSGQALAKKDDAKKDDPTLVGSGSATVSPSLGCNVSDVTVTAVGLAGSSLTPTDSPVNALSCVGAYQGNDQPQPSTNLGYLGDGFANGGTQNANSVQFDSGLFIGEVDGVDTGLSLQDLNPETEGAVDPGWITVGKFEGGTFSSNTVNGQDIIGDDASEATQGGLQSFFSCTGCTGDSKGGTWELTPDAGIPDRFAAAANTDKQFFDAFSIVLKGGNFYTAYLFTAAQFGISDLNDVYNFAGSFTMPTIGDKQPGLSHISLLAHDPQNSPIAVPEPGAIALFGVGLLALAGVGIGRRSARASRV